MRVAYLGPAGTFSEEALRASAREGVNEVPYTTVYEAVMAVQNAEVDSAVVPIENSIEGSVTATLDTLVHEGPDVRISREVVLPIEHNLVARQEMKLDMIERVLSHPQGTAQCAKFLRERVPGAARVNIAPPPRRCARCPSRTIRGRP